MNMSMQNRNGKIFFLNGNTIAFDVTLANKTQLIVFENIISTSKMPNVSELI